jgi:hypothetical protein
MAGLMMPVVLSGGNGWIARLPGPLNVGPARAWLSQRDLPPAPARSFRRIWRARQEARGNR